MRGTIMNSPFGRELAADAVVVVEVVARWGATLAEEDLALK